MEATTGDGRKAIQRAINKNTASACVEHCLLLWAHVLDRLLLLFQMANGN